jgi:hypothetical protein
LSVHLGRQRNHAVKLTKTAFHSVEVVLVNDSFVLLFPADSQCVRVDFHIDFFLLHTRKFRRNMNRRVGLTDIQLRERDRPIGAGGWPEPHRRRAEKPVDKSAQLIFRMVVASRQ